MRIILIAFSGALLSGCLARTAVDIVTLPVRAAVAVVDQGIDAVTTSQAEADRAAGRRLREEDERRGRETRQAEREARRQADREAREAARRDEPDATEPE